VQDLEGVAGEVDPEASALRWRHYDAEMKPLGRLSIAKSYNTKLKAEKEVKTKVPRDVPVHSALAALLAEWKLSGWQAMFGRTPGPDDLIIPSRLGKNRSANHMLKKFHQDLERLGIRARRQHDLRRTFISLCLGDGGRSDILR
jgi:integrase